MRGILLLCIFACAHGNVVELNSTNFDEETSNQSVSWFIKFYAPWCAHSNAMKKDWKDLAQKYSDSEMIRIGEVDCISDEGRPVCQRVDVHGFPNLKYRQVGGWWETYLGGRDLDTLSAFVESDILPKCMRGSEHKCSAEETEFVQSMEKMSDKERQELEDKLEVELKQINEGHIKFTHELEETFSESKRKLDKIKNAKIFQLSLLQELANK